MNQVIKRYQRNHAVVVMASIKAALYDLDFYARYLVDNEVDPCPPDCENLDHQTERNFYHNVKFAFGIMGQDGAVTRLQKAQFYRKYWE